MKLRDIKQLPEELTIMIDNGFGANDCVVRSINSTSIVLRNLTELDEELEEEYEIKKI